MLEPAVAAIEEKMQHLSRALNLEGAGVDAVMGWLLQLRKEVGMPHTLAEVEGLNEEKLKLIAEMSMNDPSLGSNPVPCNVAQAERVLRAALSGDVAAAHA